ncbi:MAG: UDP-N-acetylmuramate dehydrogenase [Oscillospiraceae bacterium]|nr:UDP-N-acetylmuramate dehydrogenase [Oscillospiraceae bacterium]
MSYIHHAQQFCHEHGIAYSMDVPLSSKTGFQVGGPADIFTEPENEAQLLLLLSFFSLEKIKWCILGKGSNVLFSDEGYRGAVLHLGDKFAEITLIGETEISCQSGAALSSLCGFAQKHGLSGLEFAYGIPGSLGGAVYMNAGAYGGEMKDVLVCADHIAPIGDKWERGTFCGDGLGLSYRHSAYTDTKLVITGARLRLKKAPPAEIRLAMEDFMSRRRAKQPLDFPSAGSTFKRPEGAYASALIDKCGLKGRKIGGAMVSEKHAGFVVNTGGATCADILQLMEIIRAEVFEKTGFNLEPEVRVIT